MDIQIEVYSALCSTSKFTVNGIRADEEDFVEKYDRDEENAEDYACGDMQATRIPPTKKVLEKYNISESEYDEIAKKCEELLSFGCCGWCV